jgi:hypothetical protein
MATLQSTLAGVLASLNNLLNGIGNVLGSAKLLQIQGIHVGAIATAKDTVANSSALVTASIGGIKIGGLDLGGIDVNAALEQVQALAAGVTNQLNSILATISPSLANLVKVELFKQATDVSQSGDYVNAMAGIIGLSATVTPPDLCAVLSDVLGKLPVGGNTLPGVSLPALPVPAVLATVGSLLSCRAAAAGVQAAAIGGTPALLNPVTLRVAQASSVAAFTTAPGRTTSTTAPGLPRTGMNETLLLVIGGMMAAVALGLRRASAPVKVRANRTTR